ncbi:hypothetical protein LOAG_10435 [Loa loa]|uniref:Uncharacterized protein n=1 Tax=Loa loa TaxID=7209 RepID=A0A1S0TPX3_LOALO|nr:hypothetical protein LOAG_10435 [Loa loa]EFO18063.1 hypothetical protein LOAG_10435 [Loa loa]
MTNIVPACLGNELFYVQQAVSNPLLHISGRSLRDGKKPCDAPKLDILLRLRAVGISYVIASCLWSLTDIKGFKHDVTFDATVLNSERIRRNNVLLSCIRSHQSRYELVMSSPECSEAIMRKSTIMGRNNLTILSSYRFLFRNANQMAGKSTVHRE